MAMSTKGNSGGGSELNSEINVTPMVDIMLVMLIIFMVVTPLLQSGVSVMLPKGVNPDEDGEYQLRQRWLFQSRLRDPTTSRRDPVSKDEVVRKIEILMKLRKPSDPQVVYVRAGIGAPYGEVVDVINFIRDAGYRACRIGGR